MEVNAHDKVEDANLPGSLPTLRKQYIDFAKEHTEVCPFLFFYRNIALAVYGGKGRD